jgi:hypothetical protein
MIVIFGVCTTNSGEKRQLVTSFSKRRPGFDPRPDHVRFVADKAATDGVFSAYFRFALPVSFQQYSVPMFI